ncbi:hypothetical protein MRY87_11415 [bacterium]|nr:hypothetical protein [bacterium]
MFEFFRTFGALVVPEFFEPANVVMVGVVGTAHSTRLRLLCALAIILGGVGTCAVSCLLSLGFGTVLETQSILHFGSYLMIAMGSFLFWNTVREEQEEEEKSSLPSLSERLLLKLGQEHLVLQAFLIGFLFELFQSSTFLVFGIASASHETTLTFLGAASAHVLGKTVMLTTVFGAGYCCWSLLCTAVRAAHSVRPELGGWLWRRCIRRKIQREKTARASSPEGSLTAKIANGTLAILIISFGAYELLG